MGRNLIKIICLIALFSCSKEQEKTLSNLLKENYANLDLNNPTQKLKVIENLTKLKKFNEIALEFNLLKIDNISSDDFYQKYKYHVFASSEWGRKHRTFQLLQNSRNIIKHKLLVS